MVYNLIYTNIKFRSLCKPYTRAQESGDQGFLYPGFGMETLLQKLKRESGKLTALGDACERTLSTGKRRFPGCQLGTH